MNQLYKLLSRSLPQRYNFKYNDRPIMYAESFGRIIGLYSFDKVKKVVYYRNMHNDSIRGYISLYELYYGDWHITPVNKLMVRLGSRDLPF